MVGQVGGVRVMISVLLDRIAGSTQDAAISAGKRLTGDQQVNI